MNIIIPIGIVTIIGVLAGAVLCIASKFMAVKVDEKVSKLRGVLPGANCGACGYAGCDEYAINLAKDSGVKSNLCTPGGEGVALKISELMGVAFEEVIPQFAIVKCSGDCDTTSYAMEYDGIKTCKASKTMFGGRGDCAYSCIGFGDCVAVCEYGAIKVENGLAVVDKARCVGCAMCVKACPNFLIEIITKDKYVNIACSSKEKGAVTRKVCKKGCIGCKKCEKKCEFGAIKVENNLAVIDHTLCTNCEQCVAECPTGAITKVLH